MGIIMKMFGRLLLLAGAFSALAGVLSPLPGFACLAFCIMFLALPLGTILGWATRVQACRG